MKLTLRTAVLLLLLSFVSAAAHADPLTNCVAKDFGGGISCDVYQVKLDYTHSQISDPFGLPTFVTAGYLVITTDLDAPTDMTKWVDVVSFIDNGPGNNSSIQLFSVGCDGLYSTGYGCFPNYNAVTNAPTYVFLNLTGSPKVYNAGLNTYQIFDYAVDTPPFIPPGDGGGTGGTGPGTTVPEPASLLLFGSGMLVMARWAKSNSQHRR